METQKKIINETKPIVNINWLNIPVKHGIANVNARIVIIDEINDKYLLTLVDDYKSYYNNVFVNETIINKTDNLPLAILSLIPKFHTNYDELVKWFGKEFADFYYSSTHTRTLPNKYAARSKFNSLSGASNFYCNTCVNWSTNEHGEFYKNIYYFENDKAKIDNYIKSYLNKKDEDIF